MQKQKSTMTLLHLVSGSVNTKQTNQQLMANITTATQLMAKLITTVTYM
jgi:hypothetical protein